MYSGRKYIVSRLLCLASAILFVALDQVTKALAVAHLKGKRPFIVIEGFLRFVYVENRGAAFGSFAGQRWIFMIVSLLAIVGITVFVLYKKNLTPFYLVCLTFIFAGGIGNMIDRIFLGYVVDFIDFYFIEFAVFNVADSFVTVGALLLIYVLAYEIYKEEKAERKKRKQK